MQSIYTFAIGNTSDWNVIDQTSVYIASYLRDFLIIIIKSEQQGVSFDLIDNYF